MRNIILLALLVSLFGCQSLSKIRSSDDSSEYTPPELDYDETPPTSGGLFRPGQNFSLVQDRRAIGVGDILTVMLDESTQSSKSANTNFGKSSSAGIDAPTVMGELYPKGEVAVAGSRKFDGSAKSSQQNTLRGSIAVTVHRVLPNGTLLVKGEKALSLNQGEEYIRLTGLVRREDINRYNQLSSQNVADARISYAGRGALNDSNSAGWLTRFFTHPLFPL